MLFTGQDFAEIHPNAFEVGGTVADQVVYEMAPKLCVDALSSPEVQQLYNKKFDLIMIMAAFCYCFMDLAETLQVKICKFLFKLFCIFFYTKTYIRHHLFIT